MTTTTTNNSVTLCGIVRGEPSYSHEVFGEKFYEVNLAVKRLSGMDDLLPVSVSEHLMGDYFVDGKSVTVKGQFRSYNKIVGDHSKLMLTVFVRDVGDFDPSVNPNTMQLTGFVCKQPIYRTTPFNREICDLLVAVNRQYNKSDYIPCIVWGRNARFAEHLAVGTQVSVVGRVQSRNYQKRLEDGTFVTRTAYEVSVGKISVVEQETSQNAADDNILQSDGGCLRLDACADNPAPIVGLN